MEKVSSSLENEVAPSDAQSYTLVDAIENEVFVCKARGLDANVSKHNYSTGCNSRESPKQPALTSALISGLGCQRLDTIESPQFQDSSLKGAGECMLRTKAFGTLSTNWPKNLLSVSSRLGCHCRWVHRASSPQRPRGKARA